MESRIIESHYRTKSVSAWTLKFSKGGSMILLKDVSNNFTKRMFYLRDIVKIVSYQEAFLRSIPTQPVILM